MYKYDKNVWGPNESPRVIERLLCVFFRVRVINQGLNTYLRRFYLTPRWSWLPFRIFLHHIFLSDTDRALHSHPFKFYTLLLSSWYKEIIQTSLTFIGKHRIQETKERIVKAGSLLRNPIDHVHRLELAKPVWTLVIADRATQEWGFYPPEKNFEFTPWREYLNLPNAEDYPEDVC